MRQIVKPCGWIAAVAMGAALAAALSVGPAGAGGAGAPGGAGAGAAASRPAGIPVRFDERNGRVKLGTPAAPQMEELFVEDGNRIRPAPAQVSVQDSVRLPGFSGR